MSGVLLHVGYPKTGSTWLRKWFASHLQVDFHSGRLDEIDTARVAEQGGDLPWHVISDETLLFPSSGGVPMDQDPQLQAPEEMLRRQEEVCAALAEQFPAAHVLIVTRGFRSMLLSSYSQSVRTGADWDLTEVARRVQQVRPWNYDAVLAMYRRHFAGRVIVLPYELLSEAPARFAAQLADRLAIDIGDLPPDRENPRLPTAALVWYPRLARLLSRLPLGHRLRRWQARAAFDNRWHRLVGWLGKVAPDRGIEIEALLNEVVGGLGADARELTKDALFASYAAEYLQWTGPAD